MAGQKQSDQQHNVEIKNSLNQKFSLLFVRTFIMLGLLASLSFFIFTYATETKNLTATINKEIASSKDNASLAAYTIDKLIAQYMLDGFTRTKGIAYTKIILEDSSLLAESGVKPSSYGLLATILFPEQDSFRTELIFQINARDFSVGYLEIIPDYILATETILNIFIKGILLIISITLVVFFYVRKLISKELSSPVIELANSLSFVDLDQNITPYKKPLSKPEKHKNDEIGFLIDGFNNLFENLTKTKIYASDIQDTLETTEAQYTAMVANTSEIFMRLSKNGHIEFVNPAIKKVLGHSLNKAINTNVSEYVDAKEAEKLISFITLAAEDALEETTQIIHFRTKDNEEKILSCSITNALDNEKINCLLFVARDITKSYKTEMELRQSQKLESIGKLTGGIAHDFNNILTIIINNIEIAQRKVKKTVKTASDEIVDTLELALNASFTGADLTNRLLAFARNQPLNPHEFSPNEKVRNILPLLERTIGSNITVKADLTEKLGHVKIDHSQFENAILNLCINARDAIDTDQKGEILIRTSKTTYEAEDEGENEYILIEIIDNGEGISSENLKKVVDPFFTTKATGKGTGLGLSMVYGFVHQSKGHFNIQSEVGRGTTIQLYFPEHIADENSTKDAQNNDDSQSAIYNGRGKTILILEDNKTIADIIEKLLEDMSFNVLKANQSEEAIKLYKKQKKTDLIISDVLLQDDITGFQFADKIRKINPEQLIMHMSGYTDPEKTLNNYDYTVELRKPFRRSDLVKALSKKLK